MNAEQIVKARIVLAHANTNHDEEMLYPNELILYDFDKTFKNGETSTEIRLRVGLDDKDFQTIAAANELVLGNMNFYDSEPATPEVGDVWYNEAEETFYLGLKNNERIKLSHVIENIEDGIGQGTIQTTNLSEAGHYTSQNEEVTVKAYRITDYDISTNRLYLYSDDTNTITVTDLANFNLANNSILYYVNSTKESVLLGKSNGNFGFDDRKPYVEFILENSKNYPNNGLANLAIDEESYVYSFKDPDFGAQNAQVDITIYDKPIAADIGAVALGIGNQAFNRAAFAEGEYTQAFGAASHSEGYNTLAEGEAAHAEGTDSEAEGTSAHAEGNATIASGGASHAEGIQTRSEGNGAHSEGTMTQARGHNSHAGGIGSIAGGKCFRFDLEENKEYSDTTFYLSNVEGSFNVKDKKFSMKLDHNFDYAGIADTLEDGVLTIKELTATYNDAPAIPTTSAGSALSIDEDSFLFFPEYPDLGTDILGEGAIALGIETKAQSNASFAEGRQTVSAGQYAHAEGRRTKAIGYSSHTEGLDTISEGQNSHSEGNQSKSIGYAAHAEGQKTEAIGRQSHAEGAESVAEGDQAHAEGLNTWAKGQGAHSEGLRGAAIGVGAHVEGRATTEPFDENGELKTWAKDAGLSIAEGEASHVEGLHNYAKGTAAHTEGTLTQALGEYSHAEGKETEASGNYSHTEGEGTTASKRAAHAEGGNTIASGERAHAEGNGTHATANNTHAEGLSTKATEVNAHAEGQSTTASGKNSHAEGYNTEAKGEGSHAEGESTRASGKNQHVQGRYNIEDTSDTYVHIVGNGTSTQRSNVHTLDWDGNAWYAGDITAGSEENQKDIIATGELKGNSLNVNKADIVQLNVTKGQFDRVEIGNEIKTIVDENGKIIASEIDSNSLNINDKATIDEYGNIWTNTNLKMGDRTIIGEYGQALRYRGKVKTTSEVKAARTGDIVISEIDPNLKQEFLGFYIPKDEGYATDDFYLEYSDLSSTGRIINFGERSNTYIKTLLYLSGYSEYINSISSEINEIHNFKANMPEASELFINFSFNTGRLLQFRVSTIIIQGSESSGVERDAIYIDGYWITKPDDIYLDFPNNLDVLIYSSPNLEDIDVSNHPEMEEFKKWQKNSENVFIYSEDKWIKVNSNGLSQLGGGVGGVLPIVGYEEFCAYRVSEENDIIDCLNQAISENPFVQIWPGEYLSEKVWNVPDVNNIKIKGIGEVTLDFSIKPNIKNDYGINRRNTWYWENINLNKDIYLTTLGLANDGSYSIFGTAKNCNFKDKIFIDLSHGTSTYFENCNFYNNINFTLDYENIVNSIVDYKNCNFYINTWTTPVIKQLYLTSLNNCNLYFSNDQEEIILGMSSTHFSSNNLKNNTYYLKGTETEFIPPHYIENIAIKNSSFPWNSLKIGDKEAGMYYKVDVETCYINHNSNKQEIVSLEDFDVHYKGTITSIDFNNLSLINAGDLYKVEDSSAESYKFYTEGLLKLFGTVDGDLENPIYEYSFEPDYDNNEIVQLNLWINDQQTDGNIDLLKILLYLMGNDINNFFTDENEIIINKNITFNMCMGNNEQIEYYLEDCSCYKSERATTFAVPEEETEIYYDYNWNFTFNAKKAIVPEGKYNLAEINWFIVNSLETSINKDFLEKYYIKQPGYITNTFILFDNSYNKVNLNNGATIYRDGVQTYDQLPEIKNIGDMYMIYNSETISYDKNYNDNETNYYKISAGNLNSEIIEFSPNPGDNNQIFKYTCYNPLDSELAMSLAILTGSYNYENKKFESIENFEEISITYDVQNLYTVYNNRTLNITKVTYYDVPETGGSPRIEIEGYNGNDYKTDYTGEFKIQNLKFIVTLDDKYSNLYGYLEDKRVYKNTYPSGPWTWTGNNWEFIGTKN